MGILRSDRVSGLGGANAINGSVKFGDSYLRIPYSTPDDFTFDGNFTIEYWYYPQSTGADSIHVEYSRPTGYKRAWQVHQDHSSNTYAPRFWWWAGGSTTGSMTSSITMTPNNWYHIAWVRIGTTLYNYVDGVSGGSSTGTSGITLGDPSDAEKPVNSLNIGVQIYNGPQLMLGGGHISNLRIIKGEGIYTAAFTPPTTRLEKTSNTVLLCCQSPGDVTKEETGKIIETNNIANSAPPQASTFAPDLGEDYGTTFADGAVFDTLSYMVPPGGTTAQRGRGTALYGGGYKTPNSITAIDYLSIQHGGLTQEWGNLSTTQLASGAACSSSTRWVTAGGWTGANNNAIEYVTFTTQGNSLEFGDLVVGRRNTAAVSNSTRGIWGGGYISPADAGTDSMDYITIASTGNAADFGNLSAASKSGGVAGSTTRAVWALGLVAPADNNTLEYVTIATTGNVTNFGDMPSGSNGRDVSGCSSNVRGIYGGGQYPTEVNIINYITIATTGDAVDFGDLTLARGQTGATSNGTRGVFMGGTTNPARQDTIDSVIIASTGNAVNWGDFRTAKQGLNSAASDSHGGLS